MTITALALWGRVARHDIVRSALTGINAAVVGILAAALYNPVLEDGRSRSGRYRHRSHRPAAVGALARTAHRGGFIYAGLQRLV